MSGSLNRHQYFLGVSESAESYVGSDVAARFGGVRLFTHPPRAGGLVHCRYPPMSFGSYLCHDIVNGPAWLSVDRLRVRIIGSTGSRDSRSTSHGIVQIEPAGRTVFEFVECGVVGVDADLVRLWFEDHVTQP